MLSSGSTVVGGGVSGVTIASFLIDVVPAARQAWGDVWVAAHGDPERRLVRGLPEGRHPAGAAWALTLEPSGASGSCRASRRIGTQDLPSEGNTLQHPASLRTPGAT